MAKADDLKARMGLSGPPLTRIPNGPPSVPDHELVRCIGRGSYGEVWLARSAVGTWRAIKVVYRDSFKDARPYDREFAGIQKYEPISRANEGLVDVLQIGRNDVEGYFYYVMELADAAGEGVEDGRWKMEDGASYVPKTLSHEIQSRGRLPVEECITLGITLNLALGYLHRQGLIHRDVKPSNIIFVNGVAKLADIGLVTDMAGAQSFVGTEGFIPPEGPNSKKADLYALGKVLYEAAMGKDRHEFPEPFTNLGMDVESASLMELNEVLIRACAPKPSQRYQTAEDMNADLALLLAGKSVRRTHALEQRLRLMTRLGGVFAVVLLLGAISYYFAITEAKHARERSAKEAQLREEAENAHANETRLRLRAEANEAKARTESSKSRQVALLLEHMLDGVAPSVALGRDTQLLREILDKAADMLGQDLKDQPEVEAELRNTLGEVYLDIGDFAKSEDMHCAALALRRGTLGNEHLEVAESLAHLGHVMQLRDRLTEAGPLYLEALAIRVNQLTHEDLDVAISLSNLAYIFFYRDNQLAEAEALYSEALRIRRKLLGSEDSLVAQSLLDLAVVLSAQGQSKEAVALCREALAIFKKHFGNEHPTVANALNSLGLRLRDNGGETEAEILFREALAIRKKILGNAHPFVAQSLNTLGTCLQLQGRFAEAEPLEREMLNMRRKFLGPENLLLPTWIDNLANVLSDQDNQWVEVEALRRESLALRIRQFGLENVFVAWSYGNLALALEKLDRKEEAEAAYLEEFKIGRAVAEKGDPRAQNAFARLLINCSLSKLRDASNAVFFAENAVAKTDRKNPVYLDTLAGAYAELGQFTKAASIEQEAVRITPDHRSRSEFQGRQRLYESKSSTQSPPPPLESIHE